MFRKIIKKLLIICIILVVIYLPTVYNHLINMSHSDILNNLEGEIYYTKRVDGVNTLFKSDASLENEVLIYSHKGKGKTSSGHYNDNIVGFYFDSKSKTLIFEAMNDGKWNLFSIKEGEETAKLINIIDFNEDNKFWTNNGDYIKKDLEQLTVTEKKGSIYISEDGEEKYRKKFFGIYDKFTGYSLVGFTPDGKYLIYHSWDHLTSFGTVIEGMIKDGNDVGNMYIMDLSSGKSTRFVYSYRIQWVNN